VSKGASQATGLSPSVGPLCGVSPVPCAIDDAIAEVRAEIGRAIAKFPTWPSDPLHAVAVVGEEAGELTKATLQAVYEPHKSNLADMREEAVQTAAMALRFIASLSKYQFNEGNQHVIG
jgi:NTP pyrophosphatase (non-canonical NTP hydrolase)